MLVKSVARKFADGRNGIGLFKQLKGMYKGQTIQVESFGHLRTGYTAKQYTVGNKVITKFRNEQGKFERLV